MNKQHNIQQQSASKSSDGLIQKVRRQYTQIVGSISTNHSNTVSNIIMFVIKKFNDFIQLTLRRLQLIVHTYNLKYSLKQVIVFTEPEMVHNYCLGQNRNYSGCSPDNARPTRSLRSNRQSRGRHAHTIILIPWFELKSN